MASSAHDRVEEVSFLEFRDRAGIDRRRIPIEGTVETTYRCNLNCVHCYVNQPAGSAEEFEPTAQTAITTSRPTAMMISMAGNVR